MWKTALENAKLIASTMMVFAALIAGTWTLVTNTFITKAEASRLIEKLDADTSYNKAFRLESKIAKLERVEEKRELTDQEKKWLKRLKKDLERVDTHIYNLENKIKE